MNQAEFAKHIGVSQPRVFKYIQLGKLKESVTRKGRFYDIDPELAKKELGQNLDPINPKKTKPKDRGVKTPPAQGMDYTTGRRLDQQYKAALRKLEYDLKRGGVVAADEVKKEADLAGRLVKQKVSSWPGRVSALVAAESDPFKCEQILKKECNELLEEISHDL